MRNTRVTAECTEEPAHLCTIEMHSSHTVSLHCYAEHALHCRDCDPMIAIIANYTLTLETFIFRVQSQVIVRMKVAKRTLQPRPESISQPEGSDNERHGQDVSADSSTTNPAPQHLNSRKY